MANKENNEILKEILNKKFQWSKLTGYDPADVDMFFDKIMVYLQNANDTLKNKCLEIEQCNTTNQNLNKKIAALSDEIVKLKKIIDEYQQEGYGHRHPHLKEIKTTIANNNNTIKQNEDNNK